MVFTRKQEEGIMIGDGVEVRVLRIGTTTIKLGVRAPRSIAVHRLEIYEQIRAENQHAATVLAEPRASRDARGSHDASGSSDARPAPVIQVAEPPHASAPRPRAGHAAPAPRGGRPRLPAPPASALKPSLAALEARVRVTHQPLVLRRAARAQGAPR